MVPNNQTADQSVFFVAKIRDLVNSEFCPFWILYVLDFVRFGILCIRDYFQFGILSVLDFVQFGSLYFGILFFGILSVNDDTAQVSGKTKLLGVIREQNPP